MSHVKNHRGGVVDMGSHRVGHYIVVLVNQSRLIDQVTHVIGNSDNLQGRLCGEWFVFSANVFNKAGKCSHFEMLGLLLVSYAEALEVPSH